MSLRVLRLILWGLVIVAAGAAGGIAIAWSVADRSATVATLGADIGGPFTLIRADTGEPFRSSEALAGKPYAIFFGFTHCPEVCPTTLFEAASWLDQLGDDAAKLDFLFVSVDPERDTPAVLEHYVEAFSSDIIGLTGDPAAVADAAKTFRIYYRKVPLDDGSYTMDHSASVLLFGGDGTFRGTISYGEKTENAVAKLRRLAETG